MGNRGGLTFGFPYPRVILSNTSSRRVPSLVMSLLPCYTLPFFLVDSRDGETRRVRVTKGKVSEGLGFNGQR